jgi:hypothetical protein
LQFGHRIRAIAVLPFVYLARLIADIILANTARAHPASSPEWRRSKARTSNSIVSQSCVKRFPSVFRVVCPFSSVVKPCCRESALDLAIACTILTQSHERHERND